jgi:hypothetical protein
MPLQAGEKAKEEMDLEMNVTGSSKGPTWTALP